MRPWLVARRRDFGAGPGGSGPETAGVEDRDAGVYDEGREYMALEVLA
jgi:hypothetical protein